MTRIDAHQHFWRLERGDYDWLTRDLGVLYRDYSPEDLDPHLRGQGIEGTILVQAAATVAETRFLLQLADQHGFISGVVGWVDMEASDAPQVIESLSSHPKFKGIRPMLQDLPDPEWILRDSLGPALETLVARDLTFDALVRPVHLPHLHTFLKRHPRLRVVVDHGAKPNIAQGSAEGLASWSESMRAIASDTSACCKLSGLLTEAAPNSKAAQLQPYVDVLIEAFGPRRLMWGSDWPVLNLAGSYPGWYAMTRQLIAGLEAHEQEWILGRTACGFYGLVAS